MPEKITRRELTQRGLLSAAALAMPALAASQTKKPVQDSAIEQELAMIQKQLAKPLSAGAKKLTRTAIKNSRDAAKQRLKTKLPENSEPCTILPVYPREKKSL